MDGTQQLTAPVDWPPTSLDLTFCDDTLCPGHGMTSIPVEGPRSKNLCNKHQLVKYHAIHRAASFDDVHTDLCNV